MGWALEEDLFAMSFSCLQRPMKAIIDPRDSFVRNAIEARDSPIVNFEKFGSGLLCFHHVSKALNYEDTNKAKMRAE